MEPCCPYFHSPGPWCDCSHPPRAIQWAPSAQQSEQTHCKSTVTALSIAQLQQCPPWLRGCSQITLIPFSPTLPQIICCRGHPGGHPTTWVSGNLPISNLSPLVTDAAAGRVAMAAHPSKPALLALGTLRALPCPGWALGCCQLLLSPHTLHSPCCACCTWSGGCSVYGLRAQWTARAGDKCPAEWHLHDPAHGHSVWGSQGLQLPAVLRKGVPWDGVTFPIQLTLLNECLISHNLKKKLPRQNISTTPLGYAKPGIP